MTGSATFKAAILLTLSPKSCSHLFPSHNERWRPVIIVSARDEMDSLKKGYSLEADHYITKPCNLDDIIGGIKTMISLMPHRIPPDVA